MADTSSIPSISFAIRASNDRLQYQHDIYNQEFKERLKLVFGHPDYIQNFSYGVVSNSNPSSSLAGGPDPLAVSVNATSTLTVDVNPGIAVNPNGMWIQLTSHVRQKDLDDPSVGVFNVVYLRYITTLANPEPNQYFQEVIPYNTRPGGLDNPPSIQSLSEESAQVVIDTVDTYLQYDPDIRNGFVPIAIVSVQTSVDPNTLAVTNSLVVDHTQSNYPWNRPWFSANDIAHRNLLGTGVKTATNPHAQSQNDLTVGHFTPFQLYLDHGMILADDLSLPKIPGFRCETSVPYTSLMTDDGSGTATGFPGKKYAELPNFPVNVGKVWVASNGVELAALHVAETNRIVFAGDDPPVNETIQVYYTRVVACEPPVGSNEILFTTNSPTTEELVVAGGIGLVSLLTTTESFSDAQKFPMIYDILVDSTGDLIKTPQVVYCYKKLDTIGTSDAFTITQYGPARLAVGLGGASGAGTMVVKLRVYGKDSSGNSIDELFSFTGPTWADPGPIPKATVTEAALRVSSQLFASVDNIAIEELVDHGPNSAVMVWALINPYSAYDQFKDACHIAEVMWDGLRFASIADKRIIGTTLRDFLRRPIGGETFDYLVHLMAGGNSTVYIEDLSAPRYHDLVPNSDVDSTFAANAPVNNLSKLRVGAYGYYRTRALPVLSGSGSVWRVIFFPVMDPRTQFYYPKAAPTFRYYDTSWHAVTMTAVPGLPNTYEFTVPTGTPKRVALQFNSAGYMAAALFG